MMDGLECKEIRRSELERTMRIDSEFYSKSAITISNMLQLRNHNLLTTFVDVSDGNHMGISDHFIDEGIPYYRGQDAGSFFIENSHPICIDKATFNLPVMKRSHLKKGDILLSIVGTIGSLSLVYSDRSATCSCKLAILRPKHAKDAELLATFLMCKYGQEQISRYTRGAVQKGLILEDMDQLVVPAMGEGVIYTIKNTIWKAYQFQEKANKCYDEAQAILMSELGFALPQVSSSISVELYSNSLEKVGRLDAEYYQPQYDALFETLSKFNCDKLGGANGLVNITKSIEPGRESYSEEGIPFVRVSDVNKFEISDPEIKLCSNILPNPEVLFPQKDTILLSKDGSVGIAYKVETPMSVITSGALLHLKIRDKSEVLPDYLTLVLNSPIVQLQAERDSNGAIIQHWKPSEIENVIIPVLDMGIQKRIAAKVQESFALRKQSKQLLEYAKQAVEMAIEQGEGVALKWLKDKISVEV